MNLIAIILTGVALGFIAYYSIKEFLENLKK
jgi:hypothetical protein